VRIRGPEEEPGQREDGDGDEERAQETGAAAAAQAAADADGDEEDGVRVVQVRVEVGWRGGGGYQRIPLPRGGLRGLRHGAGRFGVVWWAAMSGGGRSSLQGDGEACGEERKMVDWKLSFFFGWNP
jgi:hypothetical protein